MTERIIELTPEEMEGCIGGATCYTVAGESQWLKLAADMKAKGVTLDQFLRMYASVLDPSTKTLITNLWPSL